MKTKKFFMIIITSILAIILGACGGQNTTSSSNQNSESEVTTEEETAEDATENTEEVKELKIGSAPTTTKAVEAMVPSLEELGYSVEVVPFDDYVQPNIALAEGSIDANIIQHQPYLNSYNESNGTNLIWSGDVLLGFTGLFSNKYDSIDTLPDGAQIGMFQDPSNQDRTLRMLETEGLVTVEDTDGNDLYSLLEVTEDKKNFDYVLMDLPQLTTSLGDTDASFVPALNFVLSDQQPEHTLLMETINDTSRDFSLGLVVTEDNENAEFIDDILEAYKTEEANTAVKDYYGEALEIIVD